jgi:hypothetical protein
MSVGSIQGRDTASEARALLNLMLQHGDIAGTDHAGRTVILLTFDAGAEDLEDADGEPEPDHEMDGSAVVLDFVPPKRRGRVSRVARAVAVALLLMLLPDIDARAGQTAAIAPLPMSTAQTSQQCCRVCQKGKPCGDSCISAERQCNKQSGCACSAPASGS